MTSQILETEPNDSCWLAENPLLYATLFILRLLPAVYFEFLNVARQNFYHCPARETCVCSQVHRAGFELFCWLFFYSTVLFIRCSVLYCPSHNSSANCRGFINSTTVNRTLVVIVMSRGCWIRCSPAIVQQHFAVVQHSPLIQDIKPWMNDETFSDSTQMPLTY